MMRNEIDPVKNKVGILTGTYDTVGGGDAIFLILTSIFLNYSIWQARSKKIVPSLATLCNEVDLHFHQVAVCSKKISDLAQTSNIPVCRRWRESGQGRG
jgi:hypothetical protein